jgi:hypothetical protein
MVIFNINDETKIHYLCSKNTVGRLFTACMNKKNSIFGGIDTSLRMDKSINAENPCMFILNGFSLRLKWSLN